MKWKKVNYSDNHASLHFATGISLRSIASSFDFSAFHSGSKKGTLSASECLKIGVKGLLLENRFLRGLRDAEFHDALRGNGDLLAFFRTKLHGHHARGNVP